MARSSSFSFSPSLTSFDVEMTPAQMVLIHRSLKLALAQPGLFSAEEIEELEALAAMSEIGARNGPVLGCLNGWSL